MKRLFFTVPSLKVAATITKELASMGITKEDIHLTGGFGNDAKRGPIKEASIVHTSDVVPALKRGAFIGLVFSVFLYGIFALFLPPDIKIAPLAIAAILFFSIVIGSWMSSLIGVSVKNKVIYNHDESLREGELIIMIDCPDEKENDIIDLITTHHRNVKIAGITISSGAFGSQENK